MSLPTSKTTVPFPTLVLALKDDPDAAECRLPYTRLVQLSRHEPHLDLSGRALLSSERYAVAARLKLSRLKSASELYALLLGALCDGTLSQAGDKLTAYLLLPALTREEGAHSYTPALRFDRVSLSSQKWNELDLTLLLPAVPGECFDASLYTARDSFEEE